MLQKAQCPLNNYWFQGENDTFPIACFQVTKYQFSETLDIMLRPFGALAPLHLLRK
jgi:hypothetical protein